MRHILAVLILLALFVALMARSVGSNPYTYDEADYMYAASLGFGANYADRPTLPLVDFVRIGLAKGKDPSQRQALSGLIRTSNDVVFYRHWHGPLFLYLLIPVSHLAGDEHQVRSMMLAIPALTLAAIYFGCVWLIPGPAATRTALASSLLFLSSASLAGSNELAPHHLFALLSVCFLFLLAKFVVSDRPVWWYAAVVAGGLAFCTLEIAVVPIFMLLIYGYTVRKRIEVPASFALFAATVVAVWPAAAYKLSFVKGYAFMTYLAMFRSAPWGNEGFFGIWRSRVSDSPLEWVAIGAGLVIYFRKRAAARRYLANPILMYAFLTLAATARVLSSTPRYSLLFMPILDIFAALMLGSFMATTSRRAVYATGALFCGLLVINEYRLLARPRNPDAGPAAALHYIREKGLEDSALLVPQDQLPMLHYYFPLAHLRGYYGREPSSADLTKFTTKEVLYRSNAP